MGRKQLRANLWFSKDIWGRRARRTPWKQFCHRLWACTGDGTASKRSTRMGYHTYEHHLGCSKTVQDRKMRIPVQSLTSPQTGKKVVKGSCQFSPPLQPLAHHWAACKGSVLSKWGAQSPLGPTEPLYLYGRDQRWPGKPAKIYCSRLLWGCVALSSAEGIWRYSSQKSNNFYIVYML